MLNRTLITGLLVLLWAATCHAYDSTLETGGGRIHLFIEDRQFDLSNQHIDSWVRRSADVVARYLGRFPVDEAYVAVTGQAGKGVKNGIALGGGVAVVNIKLGLGSDERDLAEDWVLVHELIHLAFPKVKSAHHWAEEGLAVYVESVARVQAGELDATTHWQQFVNGMPNGLPGAGDKGLDHTPTWGRTYWGGALFYLLADIEIIRRTGGGKTLRDGLRALVDNGYSIRNSLELKQIYEIADGGTGAPVLMETYQRHADRPQDTDLEELWRRLGIERTPSGVVLRDNADWSDIRKRITRPDRLLSGESDIESAHNPL